MSQPTPPTISRPNTRLAAVWKTAAATSLVETSLPPRSPSTTAQRLRRAQVVVVSALLVLGIAATWLLLDLRAQLSAAPQLATQYQRLSAVEADLIEAGNRARLKTLGDSSADVNAALNSAMSGLVGAAADRPADRAALVEIGADTARYGVALASGSAALAEADNLLTQTLIPQIDALRSELRAGTTTPSWSVHALVLSVVALLALTAIIVASVDLARLSRRFLNIGVALAAIAVMVVASVGLSAVVEATTANGAARVTGFAEVAGLSDGQIALAQLRHSQTVAITTKSADGSTLKSQLAQVVGLQNCGVATSTVSAVQKQYQTINAALEKSNWATATQALTSAATMKNDNTLLAAVATESTASLASSDAQSSTALTTVTRSAAVTAVLSVAGAIVAYWGVARRLKEYR